MNMDEILQKVAEKNDVTVEEVKKDMQAAIGDAAKNPTSSFKDAFGDKEPDIGDFLKTLMSEAGKRTNS